MWQDVLVLLGGFLTALGAALLFHVPVRQAVICGGIGVIAVVVKMASGSVSDSTVITTFLAALTAAVFSHAAARMEKMPVTVFLIPCIFPFVPGTGMFQIVYSLIEGRPADATSYFFQTMEVAGAIALAIFAVDTIFKNRVNVHTKCT